MFSSGQKSYVEDCVDTFDPFRKYITGCLTMQDCCVFKGLVIKILKGIKDLDPASYILIDDNILNIIANKANSILISPYYSDRSDSELMVIADFLETRSQSVDIRKCITEIFNVKSITKQIPCSKLKSRRGEEG